MTTPHHHLHAPTAQKTPYRVSSTTNFNVLRSYLLTTTDIASQNPPQSSNKSLANTAAANSSANGKMYGQPRGGGLPAPPPNTPMGSRSATPATSPRRSGFAGVEGDRK